MALENSSALFCKAEDIYSPQLRNCIPNFISSINSFTGEPETYMNIHGVMIHYKSKLLTSYILSIGWNLQ